MSVSVSVLAQSSRFVVAGEPGETLVQSVPGGGTTRLHVPVAVTDTGESKLLLDLMWLHGCGEGGEKGQVRSGQVHGIRERRFSTGGG